MGEKPIGKKKGKQYSAQFKFTVVLEAFPGKKAEGEIARAYGVHPVTLSRWEKQFLDHGGEVFGGSEEVKAYETRISQLEGMLGQKEVELALKRYCQLV
jgi:transposase-like protein